MVSPSAEAVVVFHPPLPSGSVVRPDASLEWASARVVTGGSPWRLFSLTDDGAATVEGWCRGRPVGSGPTERALARRLVDAGLVHPVRPHREPRVGELATVVPVRDDPDGLESLLTGLGASARGVVVVDDGSTDARSIAAIAARHGARVVRRSTPGGPGAARNAGLAATDAPLIAFLDADVVASPTWLGALLAHFDDPCVAAVAPRVTGPRGSSAKARFEAAASPLDLGAREGFVQPGAAVPYVPAAAIVVRRSAMGSGFDTSLRVGEDVDLVWRLVRDGWLVRYEPTCVVTHAARSTWSGWVTQRFAYGKSAAALERRHGDAAAPLRGDPRVLGTVVLALVGRPRAALTLLSWSASSLTRQLSDLGVADGSDRVARQLVTRGTVLAVPGLARSAFRSYGPLLLAGALAVSPLRRPVTVLAATATATRWWRAGRPTQPLQFAALSVLDDLVYGAGVAAGAVAVGRPGALVPRLRRAHRRTGQSNLTTPRTLRPASRSS
jgi:mycofactocin glycosyltransferase